MSDWVVPGVQLRIPWLPFDVACGDVRDGLSFEHESEEEEEKMWCIV